MKTFLLSFLLLLSASRLLAQSSASATVSVTIENAVGAEELTSIPPSVMLSSEQPVSLAATSGLYPYNRSVDLARFRIISSSLLYTISLFSGSLERIPMKKAKASGPGQINIKALPLPAMAEAFVVEMVDLTFSSRSSAANHGNLYVAVNFN